MATSPFPAAATFDALPIPATLIDRRGIIVDVNQAFLEYASHLLGAAVRKEERVGCHITEFSAGKSGHSPIASIVDQVLRDGEVHLRETEWTDPFGRKLYVAFHANVIRDGNGEVEGAIILRQDVTERVRLKKRKQVVEAVREQIWQIQEEGDIDRVLTALESVLREEISFAGLGINVVDASLDPPRVRYFERSSKGSGEHWDFADSEEDKTVVQLWRAGAPTYRRDLTREDDYGEKHFARERFGATVHSVIDIPFLHGTLALNSTQVEAFSVGDIDLMQELADVLSEGFRRLEICAVWPCLRRAIAAWSKPRILSLCCWKWTAAIPI